MSTLVEELEEAIAEIDCRDDVCRRGGGRCGRMVQADVLRARLKKIVGLERPACGGTCEHPDCFLYRALTGPIPAAEPCAGCLPAEGDYGDGPPPMVLGRHVEGCNGGPQRQKGKRHER